MGLFGVFRRGGRRSSHLLARIADEPQIVGNNGVRCMVFHVAEAPGIEFRLAMLPTTPKRRKGDRVELTWSTDKDGIAIVETLYSAPDRESVRRRNEEYLNTVQEQSKDVH